MKTLAERGPMSAQQTWMLMLPLQMQSVLLLACRGPDGIEKHHPCKDVVRAYRASVLNAAYFGRPLYFGERADTFMGLQEFSKDQAWNAATKNYLTTIDALPRHYTMHLMHGVEILGYKHTTPAFRERWLCFYHMLVDDLHLQPETEEQMDVRLGDWNMQHWA